MSNKRIIDTNYQEVKDKNYYTIDEVSNKLGISKTKINHWIFKLNKANSGSFFEDTNKISETDFEKIELAQGLLDDGMSYEEVAEYFKNNSHSLIDRNEGVASRDLNSTDIQIISKSVTQEVQRQTERIIKTLTDETIVKITEEFNKEAGKIAHISLKAMNQSKNEMINEIKELKEQNDLFRKEIERMYSNQTIELRNRLEQKELELKSIKENSNNKKGIFKWLNTSKK